MGTVNISARRFTVSSRTKSEYRQKRLKKFVSSLLGCNACSMFDVIALSVVHVALFLLLVTFAGSAYYIFNQCELQGFLRNMAKTRCKCKF